MKPSDFTVIFNGLECIAKAFIEMNNKEFKKIWRNSSINSASKSIRTSVEENLSTLLTNSGKKNPLLNMASEVKERSSVVAESVKYYATYVGSQGRDLSSKQTTSDLNIQHPIIEVNADYVGFTNHNNTMQSETISPNSKYTKLEHNIDMKSESIAPEIFASVNIAQSETKTTIGSISSKPRMQKSHTIQKLSDRARERKVPSSRLSRLLSYGGLAAGMGIGAVAEVARRRLGLKPEQNSEVPSLISDNPFLSEANANRIVDTLCKVRGAALKLGQMLSIQDNAMINPQLAAVFERVRQSADFMPSWQMEKVLKHELGPDWKEKFSEFDPKPFAAASIGQVHRGKLLDGTDVALKIQYPGVAEGIESDIKSLMSIINLWNILPKGLYLENVMSVAERELKKEVDYLYEAKCGKKFKELLEPYTQYYVPAVYENLCTRNVLTAELVYGTPIDKLQDADQELRNKVCEHLLKLCLMEIFLFRFMQTDPNWANFFYNFDTDQIILLDFGACNEYTPQFVDTYMNIIKAAAEQDRKNVLRFSQELGFLTGYETKVMEEAHVDAVMILGEAFACKKPFNFREQNMTQRIHHLVPIMLKHRLTPPPDETYSLHRKMSGIFLLCTKLGAVIDCSKLFDEVYEKYIQL